METEKLTCRSCSSGGLELILDLGETPLANSLLTADSLNQPEDRFPLQLFFCPACTLVQIGETVSPEKLFRDYLYFSSFSDTMLKHAESIAGRIVSERKLGPDSLAAEVASNDGYLLQYYKNRGVPVLGIEPAQNVAKVAREKGIETVAEFFNAELSDQLAKQNRKADVIHANNVLAHVADLNGFVEGFKRLLKPDGVAIVEAPYLKDFLDHTEFDTIYHEHLCYYSLTALDTLFRRHGLVIHHVERVAIHGGTLRIFAGHADRVAPDESVAALLAEENGWGVDRAETYRDFSAKVQSVKTKLRSLLESLKAKGQRVAAYGAAAKGSTLLNYFGIGRDMLEFVVDRSTYKQGLYMPGVHIPILAPSALVERMPDAVLLLTWNFAGEILEQQSEYRERGGKFIIPIPEARIV